MKPSQQLAALAIAGLCGAAFSRPHPQVPYYTSRYPQHPQNMGYGGDYPKYWQGEAYSPPQEATSYYNPTVAEPSEPSTPELEERPSFVERKYPAREAIKYYSGNSFPIAEAEAGADDSFEKNIQNVKIKNDTPAGDNDKTFTRITRSPGLGGKMKKNTPSPEPEEPAVKKESGIESIADIAIPEFNGEAEAEKDEGESENWNSFTFGVVSDTLVYHDPYESREGDFERKTNALQKIEKMMGHDYSKKDTKNKRSLVRRDWPEHIQEKALKMMNNAANMQTKGQKTIDNDPQYQESMKGKSPQPKPEPQPQPKASFPVAPKSSKDKLPKQQPQPQKDEPKSDSPPQKKGIVGSGGGELVPPGKAGKLGRAKGQPPKDQPQQGPQGPPRPNQNQPNQQQQPRLPKQQGSPRGPPGPSQPRQPNQQPRFPKQPGSPGGSRPNQPNQQPHSPKQPGSSRGTSNPNQPPQPAHRQPSQQQKPPQGAKQPQQPNFPVQGKGSSGLNTPNGRNPQNPQKKPQQKKNPQQGRPQQRPANNLRKRQTRLAGPEYPPGTTITRITAADRAAKLIPQAQVNAQTAVPLNQISHGQTQNALGQISDGQLQNQFVAAPVTVPVPAPIHIQQSIPINVPAPVYIQQPAPVAPVPVQETIKFAAIVHPGEVICPENIPCPQPVVEEVVKTVLQPVQRLVEKPVVREAVVANTRLEPVDVMREVDVMKEMQVETQVIKRPMCESCERNAPKTITVCAACREAVGECSCGGQGGSYSSTFSNGREAEAFSGPGYSRTGPVTTPGGLEAFFRQKMPEHFEH